MYTPDNQNTVQYQEIKEDREGFFWLGGQKGQTGLHRFDPRTAQFKIYEHDPDDPQTLSDDRVNSIHIDHLGTLWVGTQNGLGRLDPASGTFKNYYEKDGLAGGVVSCILEDKQGVLWMSTNNGLSSFNPQLQKFEKFTVADGLPGQDLTGWGACYQSPSGEMFFGGFSGAIAFYPGRIIDSSLVPKTVLTDFRLSGNPVPIGGGSPLKQSIMTTDSITLPNEQNILSIEFSALSFFNATTNRYRYKLDRLDDDWHEVSADQRIVSYTRLPASTYTFEVQSATSRGPWSEPARLRIEILPAWYQTLWFRLLCSLALLCLLWALYIARLRQVTGILRLRHQERLLEREEIARDLHDTFFQAVQSLFLRFDTATHQLPLHSNARDTLEELLDDSDRVMAEGREMFLDIPKHEIKRHDLSDLVAEYCAEFAAAYPIEYRVEINGERRALEPMAMTELTKITREALYNAFRHAEASAIEVEISYGKRLFRVRIRDNGKGFEPEDLQEKSGRRHLGLQNMRKRADSLSAKFDIWSRPGLGTEVETVIAAERAYSIKRRIWPFSRPNAKA